MPSAPAASAAIASQLISLSKQRLLSDQQAGPAASPPPPPPPLDLRCLDGLRAVSALLVCLFHCWLGFGARFVSWETSSMLGRHHPLIKLAMFGGPVAVDFFLLLTAMLAMYQLLPALEGSGGSSVGGGSSTAQPSTWAVVTRYWRRRAVRLLPAYAVVNLLALLALGPRKGVSAEVELARSFAFGNCPAGLWRNALFITNFDPRKGCGTPWWSLALQVQFFLTFPLALLMLRPRVAGFRARLSAALSVTFAAGVAWRLWRAATVPHLQLPLMQLDQPAELASYWALLEAGYFPSGTRIAELALGAAMGLLLRTPAAVDWLRHRRALVGTVALALQAAVWHVQTSWSEWGIAGEQRWAPAATHLYTALLYWGSPLMAGMVGATMLALVLHADPLHAATAKALASPRLRWLTAQSYSFYLIHEHARVWILLATPAGLLPGLLAASPIAGLLLLFAVNTAVGLAAAALLHRCVESRF